MASVMFPLTNDGLFLLLIPFLRLEVSSQLGRREGQTSVCNAFDRRNDTDTPVISLLRLISELTQSQSSGEQTTVIQKRCQRHVLKSYSRHPLIHFLFILSSLFVMMKPFLAKIYEVF